MNGRIARLFAVAGVLVAGLVAVPTSASAASDGILVSSDGVNFAAAQDAVELFGEVGAIVPGDSYQRSLWVKNDTARDAYVRVSVSDIVVPLTPLPDLVTLTSTVGTTSRFDQLSALTVCTALVRSVPLQAGSTVRLDLTLAMDASVGGTTAQGETARLGLRVAMRDAVAGPYPAADGCVTDATGPSTGAPRLPFTGADAIPVTGLGVASLLGGFIAVIVARRRRRAGAETS